MIKNTLILTTTFALFCVGLGAFTLLGAFAPSVALRQR